MDMESIAKLGPVIAAFIAAFAAIIGISLTNRRQRKNAYSKMVMDQCGNLFKATYGCVSVANIILKRNELGQSIKDYQSKWNDNIDIIKNEKDRIRFILGDATDGLRTLSRIKSWMLHKKDNIEIQRELVLNATNLRLAIDEALFYAIDEGEKPKLRHRKKILHFVSVLENIYKVSKIDDTYTELCEGNTPSTPEG